MLSSFLFGAWMLTVAAANAAEPTVALLHVEANEGTSSGGHVAIQFGKEVYHFQHREPGILHLERDTWSHFLHQYSRLGNRAITVHQLSFPKTSAQRVRDHFAALRIKQQRSLRDLVELEHTTSLLSAFLDTPGGTEHTGVRVAVSGFFAAADSASSQRWAGRGDLQERINVALEANHLSKASLREEAAHLRVAATHARSMSATGFAAAYDEIAAKWILLSIVEDGLQLSEDAIIQEETPLSERERQAVVRAITDQEEHLLALFSSRRFDQGEPLLIGIARVLALYKSLDDGRLTLLNAIPDEATTVEVDDRPWVVEALRSRAARSYQSTRASFFAATRAGVFDEAALTTLESAASRRAGLKRAIQTGAPLRVRSGMLIPSRAATWSNLPQPENISREDLEHVRSAASKARTEIEREWRYGLLDRNCATELLHQISAAAPTLPLQNKPLHFVPARTIETLRHAGLVTATHRIPSISEQLLPPDETLRARLSQSTTLTSAPYRRWSNPDDSAFLFFTTGTPLLRPLLGLVNLTYGLAHATIGVVTAPIDNGDRAISGLRGMIFSAPELIFVNIRKGSYVYVPHDPADWQ